MIDIKKVLTSTLIAVSIAGVTYATEPDWKLIEAEYTVQQSDTLDSIALDFIEKNTYGKRELNEFKSGIIELNPWLLERELKCGDVLHINYWIKK